MRTDTFFGDLSRKFNFDLPTRIRFGPGVCSEVATAVRELDGTRAFVVTDAGIVRTGIVARVESILQTAAISSFVFSDVEPNPSSGTVDRGAALAADSGADIVIAVGGGSCIDAAKGMAAVVSAGGRILDYEGVDKLKPPILPLIAIPTTAGTGSEVTLWAVITDKTRKIKTAVGSLYLAPRIALLDPELTVPLPPALTAATGVDALTHAIEGYTARCANPISDGLALYAMELIGGNLQRAVGEGKDLEARSGMLLGSLIAGIAFGNSDTGGVHSMAEALGGMYDVAHGVANAIFLPYVMRYNLSETVNRTARIGKALGIDSSDRGSVLEAAETTIAFVFNLVHSLKIPAFRDTGVKEQDLPVLAKKAFDNLGTPDNAKKIDEAGFLALFREAYDGN